MFLIESLATPVVWIVLLLVPGLVLTRWPRRKAAARVGWWLVSLGTLILLVLSFPPFANALTYSLESRVPVPTDADLSGLDVIVVLGGGGFPSGGLRREAELADRSYPRFYHGVRLFQEGRARFLAFCGGEIRRGKEREAEIMKAMAIRLGVPEDRILTETTSRNTMQNAGGLVALLPGASGRRIAVVTSATHMLRSAQSFRRQFPADTIVPVPVHYEYNPAPWRIRNLRPSVYALEDSTAALHEWIGMVWYAVRY